MGMFLKTVFAGLVAAVVAGGVVYFAVPAQQARGHISLQETAGANMPQDGNIIDRAIKPINDFVKSRSAKSSSTTPSPRSVVQPGTEGIKYFRLENGEFTEVEALPRSVGMVDQVNPDASLKILAVMEQAERITQPDMRDRAYLDVVDYAVEAGLHTPAKAAMEMIAQAELRDTARSRMATRLAEAGDSDAAFKLIDEVEVDELRDILRLQVIEALIRPEPPVNSGR